MQNEKYKMFNNKKAINDISIIAILIFILFGTAIIIPFINSATGTSADTFNTDKYSTDIIGKGEDIKPKLTDISVLGVFVNVLRLAFYDINNILELPFWLDIIYTIIAILLILTIARNVWFGGGG